MIKLDQNSFWRDAFTIHGSVIPRVLLYLIAYGVISNVICIVAWYFEDLFEIQLGLEISPFEFAGVVLGLLLVARTNAGYDRWWEARVLWGGMVNQSRNLAISALSYGPENKEWREKIVRWTAVFPHIARCSLRGEPPSSEVVALIGQQAADQIETSKHMPGFVALKLGRLLQEACEQYKMDRFIFLQIDKERARLIDHIGGCERILKSPLPHVYAIKVRRFIVVFLLALPFGLLNRIEIEWLIPFITMFVAYPLISLDQIGIELQNPFSKSNLSHLPLTDISNTVETNLMGFLETSQILTENTKSERTE